MMSDTMDTPRAKKRDNTHISPPKEGTTSKITILSPEYKKMFVKALRKEMEKDGYDTEDDEPLSQLRKRTIKNTEMNNSVFIVDDGGEDGETTKKRTILTSKKRAPITVNEPAKGSTDMAGGEQCITTTVDHEAGQAERGGAEAGNEVNGQLPGQVGASTEAEKEVKGQEGEPGEGVAEQLTARPDASNAIDNMLTAIETMRKQLGTLSIMEKELKVLKSNVISKNEVDEMMRGYGRCIEKRMVEQDVKIRRQHTECDQLYNTVLAYKNETVVIADRLEKVEERLQHDDKKTEKMVNRAIEKHIHVQEGTTAPVVNVTYAGAVKGNDGGDAHEYERKEKSLVFHGMDEDRSVEDVKKVQDVATELGVSMHRWDINKTVRIGAYEKGKKRPIKVEFVSGTLKRDILSRKRHLKESRVFSDIHIIPDEEREVRQGKAKLRQAAYIARKKGSKVWQRHDVVWVDGIKYNLENLDEIPENLRFKNKGVNERQYEGASKTMNDSGVGDAEKTEKMDTTQPQAIGEENFVNKDWDKASKMNERVPDEDQRGATHMTKRGLAFFTGKTYLSNFYKVEIKFNGKGFVSAEHAYQYEKAWVCGDREMMERIYKAETAKEAKRLGGQVTTTDLWERLKDDRMREILDAKFTQNKDIRDMLISTGSVYLIEGSTDSYWGAGRKLHSKALLEGHWNGLNRLGEMLVELRVDLRRRRY